ncbi:Aste57867_24289 [Aphanomyces stellatus]|uniref:Aste57867_24289 protein n=1 Tax=Aphanomyces stellatus TaxID=120398 RepID=A0A485LRU3_9STRA|nr:hypothetical protein As57867_024214 [Aphanomyces stellatus]VFU00929.1 Aste57867_24289 [Aphanomyces stellatus]
MRMNGGGSAAPSTEEEVLTIQSVAAYILAVVTFVAIMERLVHHLFYVTKRNKKYQEMLVKTIAELTIVGLIYMLVKLLMYFGALGHLAHEAIDAADVLVFLTVIFLIAQANIIFVVLAYSNNLADSLDLYSMDELVALADDEASRPFAWFFASRARKGMRLKLLEATFSRVYDLPPLFSFPKYILAIQESQVIQLVDLRLSHWVILIVHFLLYFTATGELQTSHAPYRVISDTQDAHQTSRILVLAILACVLHGLLLLLLFSLRAALISLLRNAGTYMTKYGDDIEKPTDSLSLDDQIRQMRDVSDRVTALEPTRGRHSPSIFGGELLYRLGASICGKDASNSNALDVREPSFKLKWFSLPRAQFLTQLYLLLNGLLCAILCTSVVPAIDSTKNAVYVTLCFVPLVLNMFAVAPRLLAFFAVVRGVWQIDGLVLSKTIDNFVHVATLRRQLCADVHAHLAASGQPSLDAIFSAALDQYDDGYVDIKTCRAALRKCSSSLTRHELSMLLYVECRSKGGRVLYADLVTLATPPSTASRVSMSVSSSAAGRPATVAYHRVVSPHG